MNFRQSAVTLLGFLILWVIYFYALDWLLMTSQGLPVGADLMPAT